MFDSDDSDPCSDDDRDKRCSRTQSEWEALIRDAGSYVRPGDQLRPRILDAVSQRRQRRSVWQRCLGSFALACTAIVAIVIAGEFGRGFAPQGRSANDLQQQATARAITEGVAWEWALTDVVYDWRRPTSNASLSRRHQPAALSPKHDRPDETREAEIIGVGR